nr:olfactory receptor 52D1-like [Pelodiscus sinensis]|eukprot:XP_006120217.1 olfactory receptor 52D1-like [Pelodiscus sinensis]
MYLLLCMLAFTDISICTLVVPKALCIFWFNLKDITLAGCLTQMFYLNTVLFTQSAILVTMAFDRYVAICNPLKYATILSSAQIAKLGAVGLVRAVLFILPMPLLVSELLFCDNRIIPQTYCDCMTVAKLSCGDIAVIRVYGLVIGIVNIALDVSLIALSYGFIIRAVLRISSKEAHEKALSTCTAHVCVLLLHWIPSLFSMITNRFGQGIARHSHVILANLYLLIPSMLNPYIYGLQSKEFREKLGKYTFKSWSSRISELKSM